ncbi:hypothetical protein ABH926_005126 [Catenulispora sp. GP43]|uniref:hypothetical protein n=1 Tax=Catenulispora sp. GP43 TaxID=3156263 RepID=UPI0035191165
MDQPANDPSCPVRPDDQPTAFSPVQVAEDVVGAAWIRELMSAVEDAETAVRACLHLRAQALAELREALRSADPYRISDAQMAMDTAVRDLAESMATRNGVNDLLARERTDRPWVEWLRLSGAR